MKYKNRIPKSILESIKIKIIKAIKITILLLFLTGTIYAQNCCNDGDCYIRLDDISGVDTDKYQDSLQAAACRLVQAFPDEFRRDFRVYDFGFYLHNENFDGSYPEVFEQVKSQIDKPYYLLFGKQTDSTGVYSKIWVEVKLPETGKFSCMEENMLEGLHAQLGYILNSGAHLWFNFAENEKNAMKTLESFVKRNIHCCDPETRRNESMVYREFIQYDSLITLEVKLDNSCNPNKLNDVAYISSDPSMPKVGFTIDVKGDTSGTCYGYFKNVLKIYFARKTKKASLNRKDTVKFVMNDLLLGNYYQFNFDDIIQGGRADMTIYDSFGDKVAEYFFTIKGLNPTAKAVYEYIEDMGFINDYKLFKKFITHEQYKPFPNTLTDKLKQFNPKNIGHDNLRKNWDAYSECPLLSNNKDGGWGLSQLTNPKPFAQALWDWKTNVNEAYLLIDDNGTPDGKRRVVREKLNNDLDVVENWDAFHSNDLVSLIDTIYGGIRWRYSITPPFNYPASSEFDRIVNYFTQQNTTDNQLSFLDACVMLAYNGYKGNKIGNKNVNFLYVHQDNNNPKPEWRISDNFYKYVKGVSEQKIPQH